MKTKEAIQFTLMLSDKAVLPAIDKMRDASTTFPTATGGCHPLWVLGHLTLVEGMIPAILFGEPNPAAEWQRYFGEGTQPVGDSSYYPAFDEVRQKYSDLHQRNLDILASLSEADLDKPVQVPPQGREREFATFGLSFLTLALHKTMHRGQLTDAHRAVATEAAVEARS